MTLLLILMMMINFLGVDPDFPIWVPSLKAIISRSSSSLDAYTLPSSFSL